jgi:beta-1,4-mannooligosaccharide/beta-1,4-mannosyl-N-acetylglucosamine phosphorylase
MKLISDNLSNIPWENYVGSGFNNVFIWRYSQNPIINRDAILCSNSIFNSAVVPFDGKFAGIFRCDSKAVEMNIFAGFSDDAINWQINENPIEFIPDKNVPESIVKNNYKYDPRICKIGDKYYITWCNGYNNFPTIGVAWTYDFKKFYQMENALLPFNRNGVLFPKKINGEFVMLSRPSDNGHTPFGDIFLSHSKDLTYWGKHRYVLGPPLPDAQATSWAGTKVGAGPIPIETDEGWILIYHGVLHSANGFIYSFGAVLLDKEKPWKVIKRPKNYLLHPCELYEQVGDVPNVCFPCAALTDGQSGKIVIYYGCADTVTSIAFTTIDKLSSYLDS